VTCTGSLERRGINVLGTAQDGFAPLIADGLSNKKIGPHLVISDRTVQDLLRSVMNNSSIRAHIAYAGAVEQ